MASVPENKQNPNLIFRSNRRWFGDQRLGAFTVWVDGVKVGKLAPSAILEKGVSVGSHTVRIGQWWYRSKNGDIEVHTDQRLIVDIVNPRSNGFIKQMRLFMFAPRRSLAFAVADVDQLP
jgi:hypothetical protein